MGMIQEFKEFALKGNMVDMAIGLVIGGAFGDLVKGFVSKIMMPPLDYAVSLMGDPEKAKGMALPLGESGKFAIGYGEFLMGCVGFFIVALSLFIVVKMMNELKRRTEKEKAAAPPPEPGADVKLLMEIRDLLAKKA